MAPTIDIWPGLAPGETTAETGTLTQMYGRNVLIDVTRPQLHLYPLANTTSPTPTVLVFPGGGYEILAHDHEGIDVANWLNSIGFAAAVLHYRIPKKRDAAFADAQRAIRVLRSIANEHNFDPNHLGIMGFSAGANLAARLSSKYSFNGYIQIDETDKISARPDFAALIYPGNLIAPDGDAQHDVKPHAEQPPIFVMQTLDDGIYCAQPYAALASAAGVDTTCVVYEVGGHGYGLAPDSELPMGQWPKEAEKWLHRVTTD